MSFHNGELEVQRRLKVVEDAGRLVSMFEGAMNARAAAFAAQTSVVVASSMVGGHVVASLHHGLDVQGPRSVRVVGLDATGDVGLLVIDFATRRRLRLNGTASGPVVELQRVYANCPKYIHVRHLTAAPQGRPIPPDLDLVRRADTFFIASRHPEEGADASHRGGPPGFVEVLDDRTLRFPDYPGNNMFNTLGNLLEDPRCGLLFLDFASGARLHVSGRARIEWGPRPAVSVELDRREAWDGGGLLCHDPVAAASQVHEEAR